MWRGEAAAVNNKITTIRELVVHRRSRRPIDENEMHFALPDLYIEGKYWRVKPFIPHISQSLVYLLPLLGLLGASMVI